MNRIRLLLVGAGLICALSGAGVAMADPPVDTFGGNGVWINDYGEHYTNANNPNTRMDWTCHQFAVPGIGGAKATGNDAVISWFGGGTLVVPIDKSYAC